MANELATVAPPSGKWSSDGLAREYDTALGVLLTNGSVAVGAGGGALPLTARYIAKTIGSAGAEAQTLADGTPGQELTVACVAVGTGTATITPATASGFSVVTLAAAGDGVTLKFIDSTVGWVIQGTANNPTVTA